MPSATSTRQPDAQYIIGSDEVGYGSWAGPLVVCAVCVPTTWTPPEGLTDSKRLSPDQRKALYRELAALPLSLVAVENTDIDQYGVKNALMAAHETAIKTMLAKFPQAVVVIDGVLRPAGLPQARCVPKADAIFPAVSAASVIAKVNRDLLMYSYNAKYPGYGFDTNAGYGTAAHERGLEKQGACPIHRRSYRPIKKFLEAT